MINELLLLGSLVVIFSSALIAYYIFGKAGLYAITAVATITANIECLILVNAFGMEQTLGNVFFAVTFLVSVTRISFFSYFVNNKFSDNINISFVLLIIVFSHSIMMLQ